MTLGLHNASSETLVRLATCQTSGLRPEWDEVRRRFWAKVSVQDSDTACWLWTAGRTSNGRYGQFSWAARFGRMQPVGAHRVAYELANGVELADGQHVIHSCDTPLCVNPAHLSAGTHTDNMRDASKKGHLAVSRPSRQKVTDEQCDQIEALYRAGWTQQRIGDRFGIHKVSVSYILSGKRRQYRQPSVIEKAS